jgi:hypothetical protein
MLCDLAVNVSVQKRFLTPVLLNFAELVVRGSGPLSLTTAEVKMK